jgi:hypothetical protein
MYGKGPDDQMELVVEKGVARLKDLRDRVTSEAVEHVALSRAWVLNRLMRHAQVCLGEIPLHLKMRKAHRKNG